MRDDVQVQEDERVWGHVDFGIDRDQKDDLANDGDCVTLVPKQIKYRLKLGKPLLREKVDVFQGR